MAVDGKKINGDTLNSLATSKASVPKRSTTRAVGDNDLKTSRREGRDRTTVTEMTVSIFAPSGKSSKATGGRKMESMAVVGREFRVDLTTVGGGPSVGMMKVTEMLSWRMRRLANSTSGMR